MADGTPQEHVLKILYCASWGMKRNFVQVAQFLEEQFPQLRDGNITGNVHILPLSPTLEFVSNIITFIQILGLAWMVFGGDKLLALVGLTNGRDNQLPAYYYTIQNNAVPILMFVYLLAPQMLGNMQTKGAFEIYLDDELMYSKLATGRLPTVDDIVRPLVKAGLKRIE